MKLTILLILLAFTSYSQVGINNNALKVYDSYIEASLDSVKLTGAIRQCHRMDSIEVTAANTWVTVKWDTCIMDETTWGYDLNSDSTGFIVSFNGDSRVQGCGHWIWRGADNSTVKIYVRVLINGVEARCLQANQTRGRRTSDDGTIPYTGTVHHESGQLIKVQYRVSNTSMDFEGSSVFDNPVSFSCNLEGINFE